ncbi:hypothetical protein GOBAR_DD34772 [Gossypium barbadense]|nr:hypothetical protein GOBAR_DD34772 [Gossypium barbadense]
MAPLDPHSFTDSHHPLTTDISLSLYLDFPSATIHGVAFFILKSPHCIHARSIFPCQDTPAARIRYSALLNVPRELSAVMSARHVDRRSPVSGEGHSHLLPGGFNSLWCSETRVVEEFQMNQPIPPYLFAFAVGELGFREVGPRTRVYSEAVNSVLDAAAKEFAGTEEMIRQGEKLFGDYDWERFDLLVLPPSFPYGGMENPRMVFLTPTVIKGDASGAQVVAHELAHSWTGNLITNMNNEHFWLNEGFTTYAERRIVEAVQGEDRAILNTGIGWKGLNEEMERFKDNLEFTKLKNNQEGDEAADWRGQEWELYLENLPKVIEASQGVHGFTRAHVYVSSFDTFSRVLALDERYRLSESKDYEVKVAFLQLAIMSQCRNFYGEVEKTLKEVGRMKYLRPLYRALVQGKGKEEDKILAKRVFSEARECYHPIARGVVESIFAKHL